jgi:hypothetical protein
MTMILTAADFPLPLPLPPPPRLQIAARAPQRIGFWRGLGWTGLATLTFFAIPLLYALFVGIWNVIRPDHRLPLPAGGADPLGAVLLLSALAAFFAIIVLACRRSGWRAIDYLALTRPRGRFVLFGALAFVVPLTVALAAAIYGGPGSATSPSTTPGLVLLILAVTMLAPICEELVFRGFVFRVLADSRLGVVGAIVLTSLVWASLHTDKSWMGMAATFFTGLVWGWLRWRTQSTLTTIAVHVLNNLVAAGGITAAMFSSS